jgi:hypothetical protein
VPFGGESGRRPTARGEGGRDHNNTGSPMWPAGPGVNPGFTHRPTDGYGVRVVAGRMHTNDLHPRPPALMGQTQAAGPDPPATSA